MNPKVEQIHPGLPTNFTDEPKIEVSITQLLLY